MGKLSEEIGELVNDYMPAKIVKLPEEDELVETEEETDDEPVDESDDEPEETSEEVVDEESEEAEESEEEEEPEDVVAEEKAEGEEAEEPEKPKSSNALLDELNALAGGKLDIQDDEIDVPPAQVKPEEKPEEPSPRQPPGLLDGVDFDDVVSKPEVFTQVLERASEQIRETIKEQVLASVTQIAGYQVQQQMALQKLTDKFWEVNDDLEPARQYVAAIASTIQSKRPDLPLQKIFEKTAEIARKKLGLTRTEGGGGSPTPRRRTKPALVKSGGSVRVDKSGTKQTKLEKQISELIAGI